MKKIPTLFGRLFDEQPHKTIVNEVTPGLEWALAGLGIGMARR